ncbi:MAG: hypothetical protein AB1938_18020 [Myxococcota bacterium]
MELCLEPGGLAVSFGVVRVEAEGEVGGPARVTLETRSADTGVLQRELELSSTAQWPATPSEARLSLSEDGRGVALVGYDAPGARSVAVDATAIKVGWLSGTTLEWVASVPAPRTNITAVGTERGASFWVGGPASFGLQRTEAGGNTASERLDPREDTRAVAVRDGRLFAASASTLRSWPLPLAGAPPLVEVQSTAMSDFELVDLDGVPGRETLYVSLERRPSGLAKYQRGPGGWELKWEASAAIGVDDATTCARLAVLPRPPGAVVLCVRGEGTEVVRFDDDPVVLDGGAPAPTLLVTARSPASFRGIAFSVEGP